MSDTQQNTAEWYNTFSKKQVKTGVNLRHFTIMNKLVETGLNKKSTVLEIGCGIGTLTGLLNKFLSSGQLVATDISSESIEIAKNRIESSAKIEFIITDMLDFKHSKKFDFVVLPDVMEHIPVEQHPNLFKSIAALLHLESRVLIHIPHPKAINFIRKNTPEKLQIIDQSLDASILIRDAYDAGLLLVNYAAYSLFDKEPDYVFVEFRPNQELEFKALPQKQIILKKIKARLKLLLS